MEAARKDKAAEKAAAEEAARKARAAAEEAARRERAAKEAISRLIRDMIAIPGKNLKMGKYEVTQAQWQAVMGENPSKYKGDDNPVENVFWDDCKEFLHRLNAIPDVKASGLTFRLPTEAEWEYACRAGSTGKYCKLADGTEITETTLGEVAWYEVNSEKKTHPVGMKKPNAFGLYDMHGNVNEWCEDLYDPSAYWNSDRVYRGGGWGHSSRYCTAGERSWRRNADRDDLGFRLAAQTEKDAAEEKAAEERKTKIKEESVKAQTTFEGLLSQYLKTLDWDRAQKELERVMGEMTTSEGKDAMRTQLKKVECMKALHALFIAKAKGIRLGKGGPVVIAVDKSSITLQRQRQVCGKTVADAAQKIAWARFYGKKEHAGTMNQLINQLVLNGRETIHTPPLQWSEQMFGAALTLQLLYSEVEGAAEFAPTLVKRAAADFEPSRTWAKRMFPDVDVGKVVK